MALIILYENFEYNEAALGKTSKKKGNFRTLQRVCHYYFSISVVSKKKKRYTNLNTLVHNLAEISFEICKSDPFISKSLFVATVKNIDKQITRFYSDRCGLYY